jgi:hypothetical protein
LPPEDRSGDHAAARNPEAPATSRHSIATTGGSSAQYYDLRLAATPPPAIAAIMRPMRVLYMGPKREHLRGLRPGARRRFNGALQAIEIDWQSWLQFCGFRAPAGLNFFAPAGRFHCYIQ